MAKKKTKKKGPKVPFKKGNRLAAGKGRPPMVVEREYCKATIGRVSLEDWVGIVDKAKEQALEGDVKAREFLAKYIIGNQPLKASELLCRAPEPLID